ncbi:hypothetical protein P7H25_01910 [Paenibacillus larvae]|nr:hypothetical protein [Paenibacillus larvae]MDT2254656.1 hypothetical protein [Paenibacillus larvae]
MKAIADILNRNRMTVSSYIHTYENGDWSAYASKRIPRTALLGWRNSSRTRW